jgi:hypothetical protein
MRMIPHYLVVRCKNNVCRFSLLLSESSLTLTKFIEKYTKIYNIKLV